MNVLIADDNATNLKLLRAILEAEGHKVSAAQDGIGALELLEAEPVDAIISDILMPRMDGYRFCQEVRGNDRVKHLPFIVYTSTYTSQPDEQLALQVGADAYIRKPAAANVVLDALLDVASRPKDRDFGAAGDSDSTVMKEYNAALVRKLEDKNSELETANAVIVKTNKELDLRVRARTAELEAVNAELGAFSHSVAHDLRAPLRAIGGYAQALLEDVGDKIGPDGEEHLHHIRTATLRMNNLIDELLKLSHIGRCELELAKVDVSGWVQIVGADLSKMHPDRDVELVVAPGVFVEGDEQLIRLALDNLMSNAWKFTARTQNPRIEFGSHTEGEDTVFYLRDNGVGFDSAKAQDLFEPFKRLHSNTDFPGTGLGLSIVRRVVERHNGKIWADAEPNHGAVFYVKLRARQAAEA